MTVFSTNPRGLFTQKKSSYTPQKNRKKNPKKSEDFFEDIKSVYLIWEWTTPRIQCLNPFLIIKYSYGKKNPKKSGKESEKSKKIQGFFFRIWSSYTLFESEQPLARTIDRCIVIVIEYKWRAQRKHHYTVHNLKKKYKAANRQLLIYLNGGLYLKVWIGEAFDQIINVQVSKHRNQQESLRRITVQSTWPSSKFLRER